MQLLTYADFANVSKDDDYYKPARWTYYSVVLQLLRQTTFNSALELGPYKMPLIIGSDTMDWSKELKPTYLHDAGTRPWPIADNQYDMFLGLQVWEHLEGRQSEAFCELVRVARQAILSFPLNWNCPKDPIHHNISEDTIAEWTNHTAATSKIVVRTGERERIVYQFDFR